MIRIVPNTHIIVLARGLCNVTDFISASFAYTPTNNHFLGGRASKVKGSLAPATAVLS